MRPDLENVMSDEKPFGMETTKFPKIIIHPPSMQPSSKSATALFIVRLQLQRALRVVVP